MFVTSSALHGFNKLRFILAKITNLIFFIDNYNFYIFRTVICKNDENNEELSFIESFWFVYGNLIKQGVKNSPRESN